MFDIKEEVKKLPNSSGVYIMHDKDDTIIYIGKAINLKNRVSSYFRKGANHSEKIKRMVSLVSWFEYIIVENELEALILENNLIKQNMPRFNTLLKDDKTYPYIKLTNEEYPRLVTARRPDKDGIFYGPFASAKAVSDIINFLNETYNLRTCNSLPKKSCIYYQMKKCLGPCVNKNIEEEYLKNIGAVKDFFSGHYGNLVKEYKQKMKAASDELDFEKAAKYRDLIQSIDYIFSKQRMTRANDEDLDVVGLYNYENRSVIIIFFVRDGKIVEREHYFLSEDSDNNIASFISQYYQDTSFIPKKILVNEEIEDNTLVEFLSNKRGNNVEIIVPKKGKNLNLIKLTEENAKAVINQNILKTKNSEDKNILAIKELKEILKVESLKRIESYDISNTNGAYPVASMVVCENNNFKKNDYRKFKLSTVGPDDYASMKEVIKRRFTDSNLKDIIPDTLFIDGGRGQVNAVLEALNELGIIITVCGMVKDDKHRTRGLYFNGEEYNLKKSLNFVTRIQDETHRFAIEYHKKLRSENMVKSILDDIEGIGPARKKALHLHFKNIDDIKSASIEELETVDKIDRKTAENIYNYFRKDI